MLRTSLGAAALAVAVLAAGCGQPDAGRRPDPVKLSGSVTLPGGQPVKDVTVALIPIADGTTAGIKLGPDGSVTGEAAPGKYRFYVIVEEHLTGPARAKAEAAFKGVPEKYRTANEQHQLTIGSDGRVEIKLQ